MNKQIINQILTLFNEKGDSMYGGEEVTQLEHALQAATLAKDAHATDELITAALLHDIGHLLHELPDDATDNGIDDVHENLGALFLEAYFTKAVIEPVKLHVDAKRYLCAVEPDYYNILSKPSKISLEVQGGIMTAFEVTVFEHHEFYKEAVALRKWDDIAKDPTIRTQGIEFFTESVERSLK